MKEKKQPPSYPLRISDELRETLEGRAAEHKRSLNAEINARLEESFLIEKHVSETLESPVPSALAGVLEMIETFREMEKIYFDENNTTIEDMQVKMAALKRQQDEMQANFEQSADFMRMVAEAFERYKADPSRKR